MIVPAYIFAWFFFFFNDTATTEIYTLSLHDALPIYQRRQPQRGLVQQEQPGTTHQRAGDREHLLLAAGERAGELPAALGQTRSEEHTSELQSPCNLVCRLLLEKKKKNE